MIQAVLIVKCTRESPDTDMDDTVGAHSCVNGYTQRLGPEMKDQLK